MSILDRIEEITRRNYYENINRVVPKKEEKKKDPDLSKIEKAKKLRNSARKAAEMLNPDYLDQYAKDNGISKAIQFRSELINEVMKYDLNADIVI